MTALHAGDTWYDISSNMDYDDTEGNRNLTWKDRGSKTVLDLLLVRDYQIFY